MAAGDTSFAGGLFQIPGATGKIITQSVGAAALASDVADGTSIGRNATSNALEVPDKGLTGKKLGKLAGKPVTGLLVASDVAAGIFDVTNGSGVDLIVERVLLHIVAPPGGACTVDVGIGAASASYDTLMDGCDPTTSGADSALDNIADKGANGSSRRIWKNTQHLTASKATGATAGLTGYYAILCRDASTAQALT